MNDGLIPRRYAKALYKYALEQGKTTEIYDDMKRIVDAACQNPDLAKVMANPFVDAADKSRIMLAAAGGNASDGLKSFVDLVLSHHREAYFVQMAYAYLELYRKENKILLITITTAAQLQRAELDKIRALVEKSYKGYTLEFIEKVDPALIGGFMIDTDSQRLDASTRNEIEQLRQTLLRK